MSKKNDTNNSSKNEWLTDNNGSNTLLFVAKYIAKRKVDS